MTFYADPILILAALAGVGGAGGLLYRFLRPPVRSVAVLNRSEKRLMGQLELVCSRSFGPGYRVFPQVPYGEFLKSGSRSLFQSFQCRRADLLLVDSEMIPVAVFEYQGSGHFGSTRASKAIAMKSDAIKRRVLRSAGIPLCEVPARYDVGFLIRFVDAIDLQEVRYARVS